MTFIDRCSKRPPSPNEDEGHYIDAHYTNNPECNGAAMTEKQQLLPGGDFYLICNNCQERVYI